MFFDGAERYAKLLADLFIGFFLHPAEQKCAAVLWIQPIQRLLQFFQVTPGVVDAFRCRQVVGLVLLVNAGQIVTVVVLLADSVKREVTGGLVKIGAGIVDGDIIRLPQHIVEGVLHYVFRVVAMAELVSDKALQFPLIVLE